MKVIFKATTILFFIFFFCFNNIQAQTKTDGRDSILEKVEIEASFPGGPAAWTKYISKYITDNVDQFRRKDFGTCIVKFIVDKNGHISEVEATNMKKSRLANVAVEAIENGPKWTPAQQDGRYVNAYRLQPITLEDPGK